jgi:hypothetical protein
MSTFRIVDLASQADEIRRYTLGWTTQEMLAWFQQYGEVIKLASPYDDALYTFRSPAGLLTAFRLTESGDFIIFGDHTAYRPR